MDLDRCSICSGSGGEVQAGVGQSVPLTVLSQHPHLSKPLRPLVVQVETGIRYDESGKVVHREHIPDKAIRPLYTMVRHQAADWVDILSEEWSYGPIRVYVALCDSVCLVGDSRGMPAADQEREADFAVSLVDGPHTPEQVAWACLQAGSGRERNQRPRTTGPVQGAGLFSSVDAVNWRYLIEILGLPLEKHLEGTHFSCLDATKRVIELLPDAVKADIQALARKDGGESSPDLKERCVAALNAVIEHPDFLGGPDDPLLSRIQAVRSLRRIDHRELPERERLKLNRYLLEAGLLKLEGLPSGVYPDQVITKFPLTPFVSPDLVALPLYTRKPSRLNGMICLYGDAHNDRRVEAANHIFLLADRLMARPLNTQLALLECTYRLGQTNYEDEVVEVVFHLARKYVGANDLCLRVMSEDNSKIFSCKSDCQYHHHEFGAVRKQSRAHRFNEISGNSGTVGDNLHSDRQGEIIGHLLADDRHLKAADEADIPRARFRDNSALLVKTEMGERPGIAALHHIEQMFYDPADFVLLKAMLRTAEMRIGELVRNRFIDSFLGSQRSAGELHSVLKQGLLWDYRARVIELLEDKFAADKVEDIAVLALVSGELGQVLEVFQSEGGSDQLLNNARFRQLVDVESKGCGYPRAVWVHQGKKDLWVDTSYDLSESKPVMALSSQQLDHSAANSVCVVVVAIPGEQVGQLWIEWHGPIPPNGPPFTDRELVDIGEAASQIRQLLEEAWGWKMAEDAGRGTTADIVDHNLGHLHLAAERQLAELEQLLGDLPPPTLEALRTFERMFLELRSTSSKLANLGNRLRPQTIEVSAWLRHLYERLALRAHMFEVKLKPTLAGPESRVCIDVEVIDAAVLEVFMNSVDAMGEQEEKRFHIDVVVDEIRVTCMLSDNGPGIPESEWPLLFKHDHSRKTKGDNRRGLGLYAAKMYVELNRSRIQPLHSPHGRGACFALTFNNVGVE